MKTMTNIYPADQVLPEIDVPVLITCKYDDFWIIGRWDGKNWWADMPEEGIHYEINAGWNGGCVNTIPFGEDKYCKVNYWVELLKVPEDNYNW